MSDFIERIAEVIQAQVKAKTVYADPIERDGTTIIPVAKVQWGFGGGGIGQGPAERGGGGGGARAMPAGFIVLKDGQAEFRPYRDTADLAIVLGAALVGLVVGLLVGRSREE